MSPGDRDAVLESHEAKAVKGGIHARLKAALQIVAAVCRGNSFVRCGVVIRFRVMFCVGRPEANAQGGLGRPKRGRAARSASCSVFLQLQHSGSRIPWMRNHGQPRGRHVPE